MQHRMPGSGLFAVLRGIDTQRAVEVADVAVSAGLFHTYRGIFGIGSGC